MREVDNVAHISPFQTGSLILRAGNVDLWASVFAMNSEAPAIFDWEIAHGVFFSKEDERLLFTVIVINKNVRKNLFDAEDAIGRYVLVDNVPFLIVGELAETRENDDNMLAILPFSTASRRIWGTPTPPAFQVRVSNPARAEETITNISSVLEKAHRAKDFYTSNNPAKVRAQNEAR